MNGQTDEAGAYLACTRYVLERGLTGDEYQTLANSAALHLDSLAQSRMGKDRMVSLAKTFKQATTLEVGFWEMGLHLL